MILTNVVRCPRCLADIANSIRTIPFSWPQVGRKRDEMLRIKLRRVEFYKFHLLLTLRGCETKRNVRLLDTVSWVSSYVAQTPDAAHHNRRLFVQHLHGGVSLH